MALTPEQQAEIDAAIAKAKAELRLEFARADSALKAWVAAHPLLAFRVGFVGGILLGGFSVYAVLSIL
jgi:hypothetical protein